jgi:hypothetical protein
VFECPLPASSATIRARSTEKQWNGSGARDPVDALPQQVGVAVVPVEEAVEDARLGAGERLVSPGAAGAVQLTTPY